MKIAYINSFYAPDEVGGAEKSVRFLAESVVANGHKAMVIALGRTRESSELNGVRIERLPIQNLYFPTDSGSKSSLQKLAWHTIDSFNPATTRHLGPVLDDFQPDVVHTNNLSGFSVSAWSAIAARRTPVVHTLRDYYLLCPSTAMFKNGHPCAQRCTSCSILSKPRAHASHEIGHVVGNSQYILDKHTQFGLFSQSEKSVIYNAYAPKLIENKRPSDEVIFGFIGRIAPTKGVKVLIKAVKILQQRTSGQFRVLIAGDGEPDYLEQLNKESQGSPITFMGRQTPETFYNQVHWTILPSIWDEPLARVLFESYTHGVPVIGSATGGTPELLDHKKTGLLYQDPLNPVELADHMQTALDGNGYAAMSELCRSQAERFRPRAVYEQYLALYTSATQQHARNGN